MSAAETAAEAALLNKSLSLTAPLGAAKIHSNGGYNFGHILLCF
jgi:hypothetical protein